MNRRFNHKINLKKRDQPRIDVDLAWRMLRRLARSSELQDQVYFVECSASDSSVLEARASTPGLARGRLRMLHVLVADLVASRVVDLDPA